MTETITTGMLQPPQAGEVARITSALDQLLTACSAHQPQRDHRSRLGRVFSFGQLVDDLAKRRAMTPVQLAADDLLDDPVGQALRNAINTLGRRLYELGGVTLMRDVADELAEMDSAADWARRIDIIDKRWDGIGSWVA